MTTETIMTSIIPAIMIFFLVFFNIRKMQKRAEMMRKEKEMQSCGGKCAGCSSQCASRKTEEGK